MTKLFRRLPLSVKLILTGIVPLLLVIVLALQLAAEKNERISVLQVLRNEINNGIVASELNSQLHLERRSAFSFLINKETREGLAIQQSKTDAAIQVLKKQMGRDFEQYQNYTLLSRLDSIRAMTVQEAIAPAEAMLFYSSLLTRLSTVSVSVAESAPYSDSITKGLAANRILGQMANNLGHLRAVIYSSLVKNNLSQEDLFSVENLSDQLAAQQGELAARAPSAIYEEFLRTAKRETGVYTFNGINRIISTKSLDIAPDADEWWTTSAFVVDKLKQIQIDLQQQIQFELEGIYNDEVQERAFAIGFIAFAILFVILIISYSIRSISQALSEIQHAAEMIALGETGIRANVESRDAIGSLATSINAIESTNATLSKAAARIGQGDFEVDVAPRSDRDTLGNAVLQMKANLKTFDQEHRDTAWIQSGARKVNECLLGDKTVQTLAQDALNTLTGFLGMELGLLYVSRDAEALDFAAGYALPEPGQVLQTLRMGETLVGQAALNRELIHLENVPDDFLKISSAAGSATPQNLVIVPLVYNDIVEGVLELASLKPISKKSIVLVEQVAPSIATAIQSAKSKALLQELLEETQSQAEELQAQHSELESLNNELEAQAQQLQASEEELRVHQEELLQANQELEERSDMLEEKNREITERNLEIRQKAEELALSTKYKSEFLANMSHELRTPLNSILLLSRLMAENEDNKLNEESVEYAQVIQNSGKALLSLIDEILDLSKIEAGKMDLDYQTTSFDDILNELRALFLPVAAEKNLTLELSKADMLPEQFCTDRMRLGQVLKNLLSNALKFTSEGTVSLLIRPSARTEKHIDFVVTDSGIGIPLEKQELIFEAFQQADGSTKRRYGGTGLGLSISRELVKLLGGYLTLESEPGRGSIFTATIPLDKLEESKEAVPAPVKIAEPVALNGDTHHAASYRVPYIPKEVEDDREHIQPGEPVILIIEDDTAFATALLKFSNQRGYKALIAVRGDEGIRLARQYQPKAILLDIKLPVKDGWEVMQELKSVPATRHIPVHTMSAVEFRKESLRNGAVDFVTKPMATETMSDIFMKIEDVLHRHPKKVLIVEENPMHAQALHYYLSNFNVATEVRGSIEAGVETLNRQDVDCVILDMGIPDQHSYKALETVKQTAGLEGLPIIVFTGKSLSKTEENRIRQYADSIVLKTAQSYQRILDEVALFLHLVEEEKGERKTTVPKNLGGLNEVLENKKVLIADDDVRNIFSLTKALEGHKMQVLTATDGADALALLSKNPDVDIVLMDMMMPAMDGYETIERIRQNPLYRKLPILAVTAKAMLGDRQKCIKAGASDYISKPVDIDQLLSLLRVWLYDTNSVKHAQ